MKKKALSKLLALGMTAVMAAGMLTGCGDKEGDPSSAQQSTQEQKTEEQSSQEESSTAEGSEDTAKTDGEVPTLVWWTVGGTPADDFDDAIARISDYTEEKIGVRLDVNIAGWSDYDSKMNNIVNTGEYFDIMFVNNTNYGKFVNLGAFENITDKVQSVTPDLYGFIPELLWSGVQVHGNVYAVPTYKDSSLTQFYYIDDNFVQKYSIDMNTVKDIASLDSIVRRVKEGEGKSFYPIKLNQGALWNGFFNQYDGLASGIQALGVRIDDQERKVVCTLEQEDILADLEILHQWYMDGIINPDANVVTEDSKGNMFGNAQGWPSAVVTWQTLQGVEKYDAVKVFGPLYTTETIQGSMNAVSVNSKYKDEALKVLELINTDPKFRDMCAYGVEGDHFEYTEDGFVKRLRDDWTWPGYTQGTFFIMSNQEGADPNQWEEVKKQNEEATASSCLGFALDVTNIQNEVSNVNTVWDKYKFDMLTGASDPATAVPKCVEELKAAGLDTIIAEAQKQVDEFFK